MDQIGKTLATDVPRECITQRQGGGGMQLDYVSGRYVKQRLNEIFGWDGWSYEVIDQQLFKEDSTAFVHLRLKVVRGEYGPVVRDGMAYGHGRKGAEGFDFAIAEAVTDALKRAAVSLGQNLGLSLYPYAKGRKEEPQAPQRSTTSGTQVMGSVPASEQELVARFTTSIAECSSLPALNMVGTAIHDAHLGDAARADLGRLFKAKRAEFG